MPWTGTTNAPQPLTGYDFGLGYLASDLYLVPTAIPGHTWSSVSAEASELGFLEASGGFGIETNNGTLWAWGYPQVPAAIPAPQQVGTNRWSFTDIEAAITTNGDLYMWGGNDAGQLLQPPPPGC